MTENCKRQALVHPNIFPLLPTHFYQEATFTIISKAKTKQKYERKKNLLIQINPNLHKTLLNIVCVVLMNLPRISKCSEKITHTGDTNSLDRCG